MRGTAGIIAGLALLGLTGCDEHGVATGAPLAGGATAVATLHTADGGEVGRATATEVAGGKDVYVMGGGQICHAVLAEGLADVLRLHLAPVVLGGGTRLFPAEAAPAYALELIEAVSTPAAQHLTYRVVK